MSATHYSEFFKLVAGGGEHRPYSYQERLAGGDGGCTCESMLIDIPTGMGKTNNIILSNLLSKIELNNTPR